MADCKKFFRSDKAGIGGSADYYFIFTEFLFDRFNQGSGCVYLAEADSVEPYTFFVGIFAGDFAKPLCPADAVAIVPYYPV